MEEKQIDTVSVTGENNDKVLLFGRTGKLCYPRNSFEYEYEVRHVACEFQDERIYIREPGAVTIDWNDLPASVQDILEKYWPPTRLTVGVDTAPGTQPRSYEYNKKGMPLESWEKTGGPAFGCTWFTVEFDTRKEADEAKARIKAVMEKLYADGAIRGAQYTIN